MGEKDEGTNNDGVYGTTGRQNMVTEGEQKK